MIERFTGTAGRSNLIEALCRQQVVSGDREVASRFASTGSVVEFNPGDTIVKQDNEDTDVYFIIAGTAQVLINDCQIARRENTVVGELVVVDPTARRSATVLAASSLLALKISAADFLKGGESSPQFWRAIAQLIAERLRQRSRFHVPANDTPILFVGSSVEGLEVAQAVEAGLKHDPVIVRVWTAPGVFEASSPPIDDLLRQVESADFALFVFGPDDTVRCRQAEHMVPRDNVVFEMGLFIGRLGRNRVFRLNSADTKLKIPSDLTRVEPITYKPKPRCSIGDVIGPACTELRRLIQSRGVVTTRTRI